MPHTDSAKRPDVEVVTAAVVDGTVAVGDVADPPVPWWSFTKTVLAAAALVLVDAGRLTLDTPLAGQRYTLSLDRPLREAVIQGTRVEFARPRSVMKFPANFSLAWEAEGWWQASPTLQFVEGF